jgi:hypothetical protein
MRGGMSEEAGRSPEAAQAAAIAGDVVAIWLAALRLGYDRAKAEDADWSTPAVVSDASLVVEKLMPVVERSIDLGLAYLQPWSRAFTDRTSRGR